MGIGSELRMLWEWKPVYCDKQGRWTITERSVQSVKKKKKYGWTERKERVSKMLNKDGHRKKEAKERNLFSISLEGQLTHIKDIPLTLSRSATTFLRNSFFFFLNSFIVRISSGKRGTKSGAGVIIVSLPYLWWFF